MSRQQIFPRKGKSRPLSAPRPSKLRSSRFRRAVIETLEDRRLLSRAAFEAGAFDPTFSDDGRLADNAHLDFFDVAIHDNGIVAIVDSDLARYEDDGTLDDDFGTDGAVSGGFNRGAVEVQGDGKIVVAGTDTNAAGTKVLVVARYNSDGTLDAGFGSSGIQTVDFGGDFARGLTPVGVTTLDRRSQVIGSAKDSFTHRYNGDWAIKQALAIQPDGKIVAAGSVGGDLAVARFNTDGTLDTDTDMTPGDGGFGPSGDGKTVVSFGAPVRVNDLVIWSAPLFGEPQAVLVGTVHQNGEDDILIAHFDENGSLLLGSGFTQAVDPGAHDIAEAAVIDQENRIVVVGSSGRGGAHDMIVMRFDTDGALDTTFDDDGMKFYSSILGQDFAHDVAIDGSGKIVVVGEVPDDFDNGTFDVYNYKWQLNRYNEDGSLDVSFPRLGFGDDDRAFALAIQADGKIVVGGGSDEYDFIKRNVLGNITKGPIRNTFERPAVLARLQSGSDADGDGLFDIWETQGIDANQDGIIDFVLPNADPQHKDVYIEVDAMRGRSPNAMAVSPAAVTTAALGTGTVLDRVINSFLNAPVDNPDGTTGIRLHIELDAFDQRVPRVAWNSDPSAQFSAVKNNASPAVRGGFGSPAERTAATDNVDPNFNPEILNAKALAYRYSIFANTFDGSTSGVAEIGGNGGSVPRGGNDFIVSLGAATWGPGGGTDDDQVGTFMHEFGHTLGLGHGGADDTHADGIIRNDHVNYKPNYHSLINYQWQLNRSASAANPTTGWTLDYSRTAFPTIDESAIDESAGFGGTAGHAAHTVRARRTDGVIDVFQERGPVDLNNDGDTTDVLAVDVNRIDGGDPASPNQKLVGRTDWDKLLYGIYDGGNFATVALGAQGADEMSFEQFALLAGLLQYVAPEGNGPDDLTVRRNGETLEVFDNLTGTVVASQALNETFLIRVFGADGEDDTLTIDFAFGGPFHVLGGVMFVGGEEGGNDRLEIVGDGKVTSGVYEPSPWEPKDGDILLDGMSVAFVDLEPVTVSGIDSFTLVTPQSDDILTIDSPATGHNRISGTSGGLGFESLTFFDITNFTVDTAANDGASPDDSITIGGAGLVASGLQNLKLRTGVGNDSLSVLSSNQARLALPLGNVEMFFVAGYGTDSITIVGDADYTLTDTLLTSSQGGAIALYGVESASLTGGPGDNTLDASAFSGTVSLVGGAGNDLLIGNSQGNLIIGGDGNDMLIGGGGTDILTAGPGDDTMEGGTGVDLFHGGEGFDTILVKGTPRDDWIGVRQYVGPDLINPAVLADYLDISFNGTTELGEFFGEVEELRIEAGAGDDLIGISVTDALSDADFDNGTWYRSLRYTVVGDAPNASDRLAVHDDGLGDLVLYRKGTDGRSGSITIGRLRPVVFEGIERVDVYPLDNTDLPGPGDGDTGTDGQGRLVLFEPDPFELNDTRRTATNFDFLSRVAVSPTIDPGAERDPFGFGQDLPGDEDWYEFVAPKTGTFRFELLFEEIPYFAGLANGRDGLPGDGALEIEVYGIDSSDGTLKLLSTGSPIDGGQGATIGVEEGGSYFVRVRAAPVLAPAGVKNEDLEPPPTEPPPTQPPPPQDPPSEDIPRWGINRYDLQAVEVDLFGPQVTDVFITGYGSEDDKPYDLFDPKPSEAGPTPLVYRVTIDLQDFLKRFPGFLYPALNKDIADNPGHYLLVGDANGVIPIAGVQVTNDAVTVGNVATASIVLSFAKPLPDDRYTLTLFDEIVDPANNNLDGETNTIEPQEDPLFPSGDGVPGRDFVARFTVDSRPEIGTWSAGSVYVDTNGNFVFDPENLDHTNRDLVYTLGYTSDYVFAGNFALAPGDTADGFDKLAAYGFVNGKGRWLVDTDNDGVPNVDKADPASVIGMPVAGEFDGIPANGDEVGLFDGTRWFLDGNHNYRVNDDVPITTSYMTGGYPIVGDFDGDKLDDLATYNAGIFTFDLAFDGLGDAFEVAPDAQFNFNYLDFIGVRERPVAADMDGDGIDDIGLWVPDRSGATPWEMGEWYFLLSNDLAKTVRITGQVNTLDHHFSPIPLGDDLFAQFGDEFAVPVVGNFDPPVAGEGVAQGHAVLALLGTPEDDVLEFTAGSTPGSWTVTLNGVPQDNVSGDTITLDFNGLGGNDTVTLTGSGGDDTAKLWPGHGTLSGEGYIVAVANVESVTINGGGGTDVALLHDNPAGKDTFQSDPDVATLSGDGYSNQVVSFRYVHAFSTSGNSDTAFLRDDPDGDDKFKAWPDQARLFGADHYNRAVGFRNVYAYGTPGNKDVVALFGNPNGKDTFLSDPDVATLSGDGYANQVASFRYVLAVSTLGNDDVAYLHDDPNGDDTFKAWPTEAKLYGDHYSNRALSFRNVYAYGTPGNNDVAALLDSSENDTFEAWPKMARLSGANFSNQVDSFRYVHGYARAGGRDEAWLYGSDEKDTFVANSRFSKLRGAGFYNRAVSFEQVYAYGGGGRDVAVLYDAVLETGITDPATTALVNWLYEFERIRLRSTEPGSNETVLSVVDEVFTAYWE